MRRALILSIGLLLAGVSVQAGQPHERTGFFIGFGFGVGNAAWDWAATDAGDASEGSGIANIRLGGALKENLVLGAELWGWTKTWDLLLGDVSIAELKITFNATTLAVTYFPGNMGFFLRGGVGFGTAKTEVRVPVSSGTVAVEPGTDTGVAILGATGYEWRLTRKFALSPQVQLVYLGIKGDVIRDVFDVDGSLNFNWYW